MGQLRSVNSLARHIHESNLIEGIDDPAADKASIEAWRYLIAHTGLSAHIIKQVQYLITKSQDNLSHEQRGKWRSVPVSVGGQQCPEPFLVTHLMQNWLLDYRAKTPLNNHVAFERIHPFFDGNGRTGRMLMWWQEIKLGEKPSLFKAAERQKYYKLFN